MNTTRPSRVVVCARATRRSASRRGRTERTALVERHRAGKPFQPPLRRACESGRSSAARYRATATKEAIRVFGTPPCSCHSEPACDRRRHLGDDGRGRGLRAGAHRLGRLHGPCHEQSVAAAAVGRRHPEDAAGSWRVHVSLAVQHHRHPPDERRRLRRPGLRLLRRLLLLEQHQQPRRQRHDADLPRAAAHQGRRRADVVQLQQEQRPDAEARSAVLGRQSLELGERRGLVFQRDAAEHALRAPGHRHEPAALRRLVARHVHGVRRRLAARRLRQQPLHLADSLEQRRPGALGDAARRLQLR